ncbi:phage/plasmid primase, P4 family [Streptomyces sp. NBC_01617]|uniref:DNA primase family protein n=1 Tax=Streptomyces sp. NBC_01617 TaxID=2975899 RepID=UPI00386AEB46|nr:phage/plasmid primase, P4 family [Streptomyces sp. NBC_01617]
MNAENWETLPPKLEYNRDNPVQHVNYAKFVARHTGHHLRYMENVGWYRWNDVIWESTGGTGAAFQAVTDAAHVLNRHAADNPAALGWSNSAVKLMLNGPHRRAIVAELENLRSLRVSADEFDGARHLLTFTNGTVDLRTGELLDHNPTHMLTQCAQVDYRPDATAPRWLRFVEEIFPDDAELRTYYQTFLGYAITGEVREHALGVWYGAHGRNGKGTTVRTMQAAFGPDIIREVEFSIFENVRGQAPHTEQIAGMRGARMVVAQEGNQGTPMNTALLKNLSGGDRVSTRHLHGRAFSFSPTFTIVLATNHLPEFASGGAALWARTKAILFGQSFADRRDPDLEPTIQGPEIEGVAAWIVEGAKRYYAEGLRDPLAVVAATEFHKDSVDPLKDLVGELFDYAEGREVQRSTFNRELKDWRDTNGDKSAKFSPASVKRHLIDSGKVEEVRTMANGWVYRGVRLMSDPDPSAGPGIFNRAEA